MQKIVENVSSGALSGGSERPGCQVQNLCIRSQNHGKRSVWALWACEEILTCFLVSMLKSSGNHDDGSDHQSRFLWLCGVVLWRKFCFFFCGSSRVHFGVLCGLLGSLLARKLRHSCAHVRVSLWLGLQICRVTWSGDTSHNEPQIRIWGLCGRRALIAVLRNSSCYPFVPYCG